MHLVSCGFVVWLFCCLGGVFSFNKSSNEKGDRSWYKLIQKPGCFDPATREHVGGMVLVF